MKMQKRLLSLLLAVGLCVAMAAPAFATEDAGSSTASASSGESEATSEGSTAPAATVTVPEPGKDRYCLDLGEILSAETESYILEKNKELDKKGEIVVVTVNSAGNDFEAFSRQVFEKWEIGGKDQGKGVLLLLDVTAENYYGLSGAGFATVFPKATLTELLMSYLEEDFDAKNYDAGVRKIFDVFLNKISTAEGSAAENTTAEGKTENNVLGAIWGFVKVLLIVVGVILVLAVAFVILTNVRNQRRRKRRKTSGRSSTSRGGTERSASSRSRAPRSGHSPREQSRGETRKRR